MQEATRGDPSKPEPSPQREHGDLSLADPASYHELIVPFQTLLQWVIWTAAQGWNVRTLERGNVLPPSQAPRITGRQIRSTIQGGYRRRIYLTNGRQSLEKEIGRRRIKLLLLFLSLRLSSVPYYRISLVSNQCTVDTLG